MMCIARLCHASESEIGNENSDLGPLIIWYSVGGGGGWGVKENLENLSPKTSCLNIQIKKETKAEKNNKSNTQTKYCHGLAF